MIASYSIHPANCTKCRISKLHVNADEILKNKIQILDQICGLFFFLNFLFIGFLYIYIPFLK